MRPIARLEQTARIRIAAGVVFLILATCSASGQQPVFRAGTTVVPLDVTVLDRNRKPITDLTAADFTILENGVPQTLSVFATLMLEPEPPGAVLAGSIAPVARTSSDAIAPGHRRVFLVVFGYGRLQPPARGVDATLTFLRERLLPQDLVSVLLFDRATDFTTDHAHVADVVERYRRESDHIEGDIATFLRTKHFTSPIDQPPDLSPSIQQEIDALFAPSAAGSGSQAAGANERVHNVRDLLFGTAEFAGENARFYDASWNLLTTLRDGLKEYAGIEYLRRLDEEKRMVLVLPGGLDLGSVQDDERFAARANAARVIVDLIQTGGAPRPGIQPVSIGGARSAAPSPPTSRTGTPARMGGGGCMGAQCREPPAGPVSDWRFFKNSSSAERVTELTGGVFLGPVFADKVFADIDATSRFEYVLGYLPTQPFTDAKYRTVVVKVNRPGATVIFRHGYVPGNTLAPVDINALVQRTEMSGAAAVVPSMTDISLTLKVLPPPAGVRGDVIVDLRIAAARLSLAPAPGGFVTGSLMIQVFCSDAKQQIVGSLKDRLELNLDEAARSRMLADGIAYSTRVPVTGTPAYVKAVVYDFGSDLLGSAVVALKR